MIYATFTMDCEQLNENSRAGGPVNWGLSERAIVGLAERCREREFLATYFIIPQTARQHSRLFLDLQKEGFELGMHLHAWDQGWQEYVGGLTPDLQRRALQQASDLWSDALGQSPRAYRSGHFSGNDYTFPLLAELGFTHGSASVPRRRMVQCRAVWEGSPQHPYWTHAANRLVEGDLPFLNVPVTCHPSRWHDAGNTGPWEIRIEGAEWEHHAEIFTASLDWQIAANAPMLTCVPFTHNTREYSDPGDQMTERLIRVMDIMEAEAERRGMELKKTTVGGIYQDALQNRGEQRGKETK